MISWICYMKKNKDKTYDHGFKLQKKHFIQLIYC